jgi:hypothetical protein
MSVRQRWIYRTDDSGRCRAIPCDVIPQRGEEILETLEERTKRTLYELECKEGARFNGVGEFNNKFLKKVWVDNVERDAAFDRRREQAWARQRERLQYD